MLNIPDSVKALYKQDGVRKNFRAHFPGGELPDITNDNIVQESVKFTESICSQDVFKFGLTEASVIEFETVGVANMYGMMIECSSEIDCSSLSAAEIAEIEAGTWDGEFVPLADSDLGYAFFRVPYGVFRVESCPRDHQAMAHRRVTAYSAGSDMLDSAFIPNLPQEMYCQSITVDINGIQSLLFGTGLELLESGVVNDGYYPAPNPLYDSVGAEYYVYLEEKTSGQNYYYSISRSEVIAGATVSGWYSYSFIQTELTDATIDRYNAAGEAVAEVLDSQGLDLTFASDGRKVYADNKSALKDAVPYIFSPAICYIPYRENVYFHEGLFKYVRMDGGELYPVLTGKRDNNSAFISDSGQEAFLAYVYGNGTPFYVRIRKKEGSTTYDSRIQVDDVTYAGKSQIKRNLYGLTNYGAKVKIENSGDLGKTKADPTYGVPKFSVFNYADSVNVRRLMNSVLELNASFDWKSRSGGAIQKRLSNNTPTAIAPGEYSQMWWDEYEVELIGTVRYSYLDEAGEEQVVDYRFGDGASVYDMTDNEVLKMMDGASRDTIEALLDSSFVPYLAPINFTPIDLSMKGLPYIEAGDALTVTAQDGTVCNSYALRRELDGVQVLTDQIDSESGLIIDSEEGGT